jgi:hypothetical protein
VTARHSKSAAKHKPEASADLKLLVEEWVKKRFGIPGIVALTVLLALGGMWWKWDEVVKVPGVADLVKFATKEPLPRGDPQRFSIAVTHLDGDTNGDDERLLVDGLQRFGPTDPKSSLPDLKILRFDRTIELKGGDQELAVSKGNQMARRLLTESGADVVLWGMVFARRYRNSGAAILDGQQHGCARKGHRPLRGAI